MRFVMIIIMVGICVGNLINTYQQSMSEFNEDLNYKMMQIELLEAR